MISGCTSAGHKAAIEQIDSVVSGSNAETVQGSVRGISQWLPLTLPQYVAEALKNNMALQAASNRWQAAVEKTRQAGALSDPTIEYDRENGTDYHIDTYGISQRVPFFGKRGLQTRMAEAGAEAEKEKFEIEYRKLVRDVKNTCDEYYYLGRRIEVTSENLKLLAGVEAGVRAKYETGKETQAALLQTQVEIGKLGNELQSLENLRQPLSAKLCALIGFDGTEPLPWPKQVMAGEAAVADEELMAKLKKQNPNLRLLEAMVNEQIASERLAGKSYLPNFEFGYEHMTENMPVIAGSEKQGSDKVMVSMNVPLWFAKNNAGVREAQDRYEAAVADEKQKTRDFASDLKNAIFNFKDAERKMALYRENLVPKAEQAFQTAQQGFKVSKVGFTDVIDAQRMLLELQLSGERALVDREEALAEIEMLAGDGAVKQQE